MKKLFIVANWKSNKTTSQCYLWFQSISGIKLHQAEIAHKEVIVCPSYTLLSEAKKAITESALPIKLGGQNLSPFDEGAYTGEVNGLQIREFGEYVIIGHSERRERFSESDDLLSKKVEVACHHTLIPVFCVQNEKIPIPNGVAIVAYEPIGAIGTSKPDSPKNADEVARVIKEKQNIQYVLYGGSVTAFNAKSFTDMPHIDGVLVGGASLDPFEFLEIVKHA